MNQLRAVVASLILALGLTGGAWGQSLIVNFDDYTLTEEDSPLIVSHVIVQNNGTLFLEPGAELVITGKQDDRPLWLRHGGRLVAAGTAEKPVIIRQSAPNSNVVAERWGGEDHGTIIDLNHMIWDMGVSRLVLIEHPEENYPDAEPIMIARNSVIKSAPPPASEDWDWWDWEFFMGPMIASVGDVYGHGFTPPMHLLFEDCLIASPTVTAIGISNNQVLNMRRCVVQGARIEEGPRFGILVSDWDRTSLIRIEDSRFVGNSAAIGHFGEAYEGHRAVQISGSDFSQPPHLLMDFGYGNLFLSVEDSHVTRTYIEDDWSPRTMVFTRCFSEDGPPYTDTPGNEIVIDPLDESPFRHADINGDGRTDYADLRELMKVLAGEGDIEPDDIDGDGDITIRDAALLRAYVDGTLLFLPPQEAP
jgi:hypothetical protein